MSQNKIDASEAASRIILAAVQSPNSAGIAKAFELLRENPKLVDQDFCVACVCGDVSALKKQLRRRPELATAPCGPLEWKPLHYIAHSRLGTADRHESMAGATQLLLDAGADPNSVMTWKTRTVKWQLPALVGAVSVSGNCRLVEVLLKAGAQPNDGQSALRAATRERLDCLQLLLEHGADVNAVCIPQEVPPLHWMLDFEYREAGVRWLVEHGADPNIKVAPFEETALHVATRRRRVDAVRFLLRNGADIDARTVGGRTAYAHAVCRGFDELARLLAVKGADTGLTVRDQLAAALIHNRLEEARALMAAQPDLASGMNVEEARILPDVAARGNVAALALLVDAGVPLDARGLDGGTALHQSAWFGQPAAARLLIRRGAPLEILCVAHQSTPLGWVAHGSRYSGGAEERQKKYVEIAQLLLTAGASLVDPLHPSKDRKGSWLLYDASPGVAAVLRRRGAVLEPVRY